MYSFYGGRPGNSFTIVASFPTVQEMITNFKDGPNYTDVHYDEHVIINTEDKNNPTNGQIYRRGYDYNNKMGGAELIGTIVGPAGKAPLLTMDQYSTIDNMQGTTGLVEDEEDGHYISMKSRGQLTIDNGGLIPGKDKEENFHDTIKWVSYSFRDPQGRDTIAHVGFQIPYPVIDFVSESGNFYEQPQVTPVPNEDEQNHPFYKKWKLKIPKGQRGNSAQGFRVITPDQNVNIEAYKTAAEMANDRENNREILVYDYCIYNDSEGNPKQDPQRKTFYIGDYNMIESIDVTQDGTLTITYTHDDDQKFDNMIKWIENVTLADDGVLSLKYNNQEEVTNLNQIKWITGLYLESNGRLYAKYNYGDDEEITTSASSSEDDQTGEASNDSMVLRWITDVQLSSNGVITIYYNNGEAEEINNEDPLKFINNIELTNDGILTVEYNTLKNSERPEEGNLIEEVNADKPIKWISGIDITDQNGVSITDQNVTEQNNRGKLIVNYNRGDPDVFSMRYPTNIEIDETLDEKHPENQYKIKTTYSNGDINYSVSPINYIKKMLVSSNGHLLAQYTNQNQNVGASTTINNVTQDWADLGIVSPEAFGFNNSTTTITNKYLTGLLVPSEMKNNYEDLTFSVNISQFLPKNLLSISITGCDITIYYSDNTSETILIDTDHSYITSDKNIIISSNLFGIDFIFTNFSNKSLSEKTLINILINSLDLAFNFDNSTEEAQSEIHDLASLTGRVVTLETKTNQLADTTVPAISQDVSAINQIIPKSSISSYSAANRTIISDLNNINAAIGNTSEISAVNTGGTTIVNSLKALNTPPIDSGLLTNVWIVKNTKKSAVPTRLTNNVFDEKTPNKKLNGSILKGTNDEQGQQIIVIGNSIISKQRYGYILQFSYYDGTTFKTIGNGHYQYYFIPKYLGSTANRAAVQVPLVMPDGTFASKKILIKTHLAGPEYYSGVVKKLTTFIQGDSSFTTTARKNGLKFALTGIYGV